jgi:hypothetical protein
LQRNERGEKYLDDTVKMIVSEGNTQTKLRKLLTFYPESDGKLGLVRLRLQSETASGRRVHVGKQWMNDDYMMKAFNNNTALLNQKQAWINQGQLVCEEFRMSIHPVMIPRQSNTPHMETMPPS